MWTAAGAEGWGGGVPMTSVFQLACCVLRIYTASSRLQLTTEGRSSETGLV